MIVQSIFTINIFSYIMIKCIVFDILRVQENESEFFGSVNSFPLWLTVERYMIYVCLLAL